MAMVISVTAHYHVSKLAKRCNALSCFEASEAMQKQTDAFRGHGLSLLDEQARLRGLPLMLFPLERYWTNCHSSNNFATSNPRSTCFCSHEENEAVPKKNVHRSGNQQATMVTFLKRTGRTLHGFSYYIKAVMKRDTPSSSV